MRSALLVLVLLVGTVSAAPSWSEGVTADQQDRAEALWNDANALVVQRDHAHAVEKYRAAIALWNHPKIQLNLAMSLLTLERYLEASDALEQALRYGQEPFSPEDYAEALNFRKLVDGRIGVIEASCDQKGARITLDGKPWFTCPGKQQQRVLADRHTVTGELAGYVTRTRPVVVLGGTTVRDAVTLVSLESAVRLEYPYRRWIPWTVASAGAVVAAIGLGVWIQARNDMDDVEVWFRKECPAGCPISSQPALAAARDDAHRKGAIGLSTLGVGGAVALTGVVMAIFDRPRRVVPVVEVAPGGGVSASVVGRF